MCIRDRVPDVAALPNKGMKAQFHFLRSLAPWLIIAATFLGCLLYTSLKDGMLQQLIHQK